MYKINKLTLKDSSYPKKLAEIPSSPRTLFYISDDWSKLLKKPAIAIVGSRKMSGYGRAVTEEFVRGLSQAGVVIVSGLALGIDSVAHKEALENREKTIAVLPCGLDSIYPATHHSLAQRIIKQGGALVSEYPPGMPPQRQNFIARNRIVSGLADAVLITEAAEKSGTLHTANFALEQGRDVFAIPGNITSYLSRGTNNLIKAGATPVTNPKDVLQILGLDADTQQATPVASNKEERIILELLLSGVTDADRLLIESDLDPSVFNQTLTMLEISGKVKPLGGGQWTLS